MKKSVLYLLALSVRTAEPFLFTRFPLRTPTSFQSTLAPVSNTNNGSFGLDHRPLTSKSSFEDFDYTRHWYPVVWARDLAPNRPTRVTVFDTDYVVARIPKETDTDDIICMHDRCPHKSASLSEGRITSAGHFQCAYHGWSFNGTDGTCMEIPQVTIDSRGAAKMTARACGTAVPAMIVQGMVWIFPGGNLEAALQAPPPPTVPEMDMEGFKTVCEIRDFDVDWSILLENIMDPDHGLFAHGASSFDLYCASGESPITIEEEELDKGRGWTITSKVDAVQKLIAYDKKRGGKAVKTPKSEQIKVGTTTFVAPSLVAMGRRDKETGETGFITAFWVCPVGTGRSRFMSVASGKVPFLPPRWFFHINLNNFLDQDTHLLATQQKYILNAEAKVVKDMIGENGETPQHQRTNVRRNNYVYRSPAEKLGIRVGALWDATLHRAPNRVATLLKMDSAGAFRQQPSREIVLDRYAQHTKICPDSQAVVTNCKRLKRASKMAALFVAAVKAFTLRTGMEATPFVSRLNSFLKPAVVVWTLALSSMLSWLADKVQKEFSFKYTESHRNRDMDRLPTHWADQ